MSGPPISQIAAAEPLAEPGETVLSPEAWDLVGGACWGVPVGPPGPGQARYIRVEGMHGVLALPPPPPAVDHLPSHIRNIIRKCVESHLILSVPILVYRFLNVLISFPPFSS